MSKYEKIAEIINREYTLVHIGDMLAEMSEADLIITREFVEQLVKSKDD